MHVPAKAEGAEAGRPVGAVDRVAVCVFTGRKDLGYDDPLLSGVFPTLTLCLSQCCSRLTRTSSSQMHSDHKQCRVRPYTREETEVVSIRCCLASSAPWACRRFNKLLTVVRKSYLPTETV